MNNRYGRNVKQDLADLSNQSIDDLRVNRLYRLYESAVARRKAQDLANARELNLNIPHIEQVKRRLAEEIQAEAEKINGNIPVASVFDAYRIVKARKDADKDAGLRALRGHLESMWRKNRTASITANSYLALHDHYKKNYPRSAAAEVLVEISEKGYATLPVNDLSRIASQIETQADYDRLILKYGLDGPQPHQKKARQYILSLINGGEPRPFSGRAATRWYGPFYGDPEGADPDVLWRPFGGELAPNPDEPYLEEQHRKKLEKQRLKERAREEKESFHEVKKPQKGQGQLGEGKAQMGQEAGPGHGGMGSGAVARRHADDRANFEITEEGVEIQQSSKFSRVSKEAFSLATVGEEGGNQLEDIIQGLNEEFFKIKEKNPQGFLDEFEQRLSLILEDVAMSLGASSVYEGAPGDFVVSFSDQIPAETAYQKYGYLDSRQAQDAFQGSETPSKFAVVYLESGGGAVVEASTAIEALNAADLLIRYTAGDADMLSDIVKKAPSTALRESGAEDFLRRVSKPSSQTYPFWDEKLGPALSFHVEGMEQPILVYPTTDALSEDFESYHRGRRQAQDFEKDEFEPDEDDVFVQDARGGRSEVIFGGKNLGTFVEWYDIEDAIREEGNRQKFWPNIWHVSDHGNFHLVEDFDWDKPSREEEPPEGELWGPAWKGSSRQAQEDEMIEGPKGLAKRLFDYHGGQGSSTYEVASNWFSGHPARVVAVEGTISELESFRDHEEYGQEVAWLIDELQKVLDARGREYGSREEIIDGMARAFFVMDWADEWEYAEEDADKVGIEINLPFGSGSQLMDEAPPTPPEALELATKFYENIEQQNDIDLSLFIPPGEDENFDRDEFGHYLAMQGMGSGVGWSDRHEDHGLKIPYEEAHSLGYDGDPELRKVVDQIYELMREQGIER